MIGKAKEILCDHTQVEHLSDLVSYECGCSEAAVTGYTNIEEISRIIEGLPRNKEHA